MAVRAGVSPAVLRALLTDNPEAMPADAALVWKFTRATLAHDAAADEYRETIVKRWGRRGLVNLALQSPQRESIQQLSTTLLRQGVHARRGCRHAPVVRSRAGPGPADRVVRKV
jgi:hypothetical protein